MNDTHLCAWIIFVFAASRSHADEDDDSEGDEQMDDEAYIEASDCLFSHYDNAHRLAICLLVLQGVRIVRSSSYYCLTYESEFLHGHESLYEGLVDDHLVMCLINFPLFQYLERQVESLQETVKQMRLDRLAKEVTIRKEVCQEMSEQFVRMDTMYK